MSTDLYGVRIQSIDKKEKKFQVRIFVVYYDVSYKSHQPIPKDYSFFFRILRDNAESPDAIAKEVSIDQFLTEEWVDVNTYKYISKIDLLSTKNSPLEDFSSFSDFYYERNGSWEDEEQLVQATYDVYVTKSEYLDHLEEDMSWGTTCYQTKAIKLNLEKSLFIPDISNPVIKLEPFKGKETEASTIDKQLFSNDMLFVISFDLEIVAYEIGTWKEKWRYQVQNGLAELYCDHKEKLLWIDEKTILDFDGNKVEKKIFPEIKFKNIEEFTKYKSPLGNYHIIADYREITVFDTELKKLWSFKSKDDLYYTFFNDDSKLIIREESARNFLILDFKTGEQIDSFTMEGIVTETRINSDNTLISVGDLKTNATRVFDLKTKEIVFEYSTKSYNDNFLHACHWSPKNDFISISVIGTGGWNNHGYGGYLTIYKPLK